MKKHSFKLPKKKYLLRVLLFLYVILSGFLILFWSQNYFRNQILISGYEQGQTDFINELFSQVESNPCKQIELGKGEKTFHLIDTKCLHNIKYK